MPHSVSSSKNYETFKFSERRVSLEKSFCQFCKLENVELQITWLFSDFDSEITEMGNLQSLVK